VSLIPKLADFLGHSLYALNSTDRGTAVFLYQQAHEEAFPYL
jgi:hypothetical protein